MANVNNPNGFTPYINPGKSGRPTVTYLPLSATNSEIWKGTPVTISSGDVNRAGTSSALCGIAAEYKAANSGGQIAVWADPQQLFVAQCDDGAAALATAAEVGKNCTFTGVSGSNGRSTAEIDEDTNNTTATLLFKTIRLSDELNNATGEFNRLVVKINNHQFGQHTGTAGS